MSSTRCPMWPTHASAARERLCDALRAVARKRPGDVRGPSGGITHRLAQGALRGSEQAAEARPAPYQPEWVSSASGARARRGACMQPALPDLTALAGLAQAGAGGTARLEAGGGGPAGGRRRGQPGAAHVRRGRGPGHLCVAGRCCTQRMRRCRAPRGVSCTTKRGVRSCPGTGSCCHIPPPGRGSKKVLQARTRA